MSNPSNYLIKRNRQKAVFFLLFLICLFYLAWRLIAIWKLPFLGDEPDDYNMLLSDLRRVGSFFNDVAYPDQSRMPILMSMPLIMWLKTNSLIPLRILFLVFYFLYLWISFKLVNLVTKDKTASWGYALFLLTSCYLSSFSVFSMTSSDWSYLFFHALCLYWFYKSLLQEKKSGIFMGYLQLALLLALCIANKLFGIFIFAALFLFHITAPSSSQEIRINSANPKEVLGINFIYLFILLLINICPLPSKLKLILAFFEACLYLLTIGVLIIRERKGDFRIAKVNRWLFWCALGFTSLSFTLIFSPVYLNFNNLLEGIPKHFATFGPGILTSKAHVYDILMIMLIKFGLIPSFLLLIPIFLFFKYSTLKRDSFPFLVALIFLVHFLIISSVSHKVTWYPLDIFPFLYLPFIWMWVLAKKQNSSKLKIIALLCFFVIVTDNNVRYFRWFPYSHFDGAQYGKEQIGWNKSAMLTFEDLPFIYQSLISLPLPPEARNRPLNVSCQLVYVPHYNRYKTSLLQYYFEKDQERFNFTTEPFQPDGSWDVLLSSPIYNPEFEDKLDKSKLKLLNTISIKGIDMVSIWVKKTG